MLTVGRADKRIQDAEKIEAVEQIYSEKKRKIKDSEAKKWHAQ